jgi:hypothetical protein
MHADLHEGVLHQVFSQYLHCKNPLRSDPHTLVGFRDYQRVHIINLNTSRGRAELKNTCFGQCRRIPNSLMRPTKRRNMRVTGMLFIIYIGRY